MKYILILAALAAIFLVRMAFRTVQLCAKEEDRQIQEQLADDRLTAAYFDDHEVSGLIEED